MNRKRFLLALCATAGLMIGMGQAQAKPNFTGDWTLNVDKSNFGPMPAPTTMTQKINHEDPNLKLSVAQTGAQGDLSYDVAYTTDGKETTNNIRDMEAKSTAKWEGDALIVETKLNAGGTDILIKGKWTLSEDGKTLTNTSHLVSPQGEIDFTSVFDKTPKK
jgi:hypothetical protein